MHKLGLCAAFLASGIVSTCACQLLVYEGAAEPLSLLIPFFNYLGLILSGIFDNTQDSARSPPGKEAVPSTESDGYDSDAELRFLDNFTKDDASSVGILNGQCERRTPLEQYDESTDLEGVRLRSTTPELNLDRIDQNHEPTAQVKGNDTLAISDNIDNSREMKPDEAKLRIGGIQCSLTAFIVFITVLDVLGFVLLTLSIQLAGSGLFEVVYSSVVAWSALFSRIVLGKHTNMKQSIGIVVVIAGLIADSLAEVFHSGLSELADDVYLGCVLGLACAFVYAISYVVSEAVMCSPNPPNPKVIASRMGMYSTLLCGTYILAVTLPNWKRLVTDPIQSAQGNLSHILVSYAIMMLSQLIHMVLYFKVLAAVGAVTTGILGGLRSAALFFASAIMFCSFQESQCLNWFRVSCALIVVIGVFVYSIGSNSESVSGSHEKSILDKAVCNNSHDSDTDEHDSGITMSHNALPTVSALNRHSPFLFLDPNLCQWSPIEPDDE